MKEHKNSKWAFALALWFEESQWEKAYAAVWILLSPKTQTEMKSIGIKDAEDVPVGRLFSSAAKYADMLDHIRTKWKDLDLKDLSFWDGYSKESIGDFMGEKKEMLLALKQKFKGFTPRVLMILHSHYSINTVSDNQKFETHIKDLNPEEQEFLQKTLPEYTKRLPFLLQSLAFWSEKNTKVIDAYIKSPGINYADAIDMFVLSWGNVDISRMNSFEKSQLIIRTFLMLRKNDGKNGYVYGIELAKSVLQDSTEMNIPKDVKLILKDVIGVILNAMLVVWTEAVNFVRWAFEASPWGSSLVLAWLAWALSIAIMLTPIWRVTRMFMLVLTAMWIWGAAYAGYKITDDGGIVDEKSWKKVIDIESIADQARASKK